MKVYTDIEQSKKLADILPLESADMFYRSDGNVKLMWEHLKDIQLKNPCWSLAALIALLPSGSQLIKNMNGKYFCSGVVYDNPIDACVSEIELLVETKNWKFNNKEE